MPASYRISMLSCSMDFRSNNGMNGVLLQPWYMYTYACTAYLLVVCQQHSICGR